MYNGWLKAHRMLKKAISVVLLVAFVGNYILSDAWAAVDMGEMPFDARPGDAGLARLDVETFTIPAHLGEIKLTCKGKSDRFIVHIQDAHCNHFAQKKISDIIDYLNKEYGVNVINLEGGAGDYNLDVFTAITGGEIRREVAEYFLKKGEINGAELYAINNPDRVTLWGIEDKDLYLENLKVYRDSLTYMAEVEKYLGELTHVMNNLKRHIFTPDLLKIDMAYNAYKAGNSDFRDYLEFLVREAKSRAIDVRAFKNLYLLSSAMDMEEGIDFKKANAERSVLVDRLKEGLSKNEIRDLVAKTVDFKTRRLSPKVFYGYLLKKARELGLDIGDYPALSNYIVYVSTYEAVDRSRVMEELDALEAEVKEPLYKNDIQRELNGLSKDLAILKNIFAISLTKTDYRYYLRNRASFDAVNFTAFIEKQAPKYRITARADAGITRLDGFREEISKFYEYSFKRDDIFLKNMRFGKAAEGVKGAVLMTGGFHTENLCDLFEKENISYVSVLPKFRIEKGYECPYFDILAGETANIQQMLRSVIAQAAMLQVASFLSPAIAEAVWGEAATWAFKAAVKVQEMVAQRNKVVLTDAEGRTIEIGGMPCEFGRGAERKMTIAQLLSEVGYTGEIRSEAEPPAAEPPAEAGPAVRAIDSYIAAYGAVVIGGLLGAVTVALSIFTAGAPVWLGGLSALVMSSYFALMAQADRAVDVADKEGIAARPFDTLRDITKRFGLVLAPQVWIHEMVHRVTRLARLNRVRIIDEGMAYAAEYILATPLAVIFMLIEKGAWGLILKPIRDRYLGGSKKLSDIALYAIKANLGDETTEKLLSVEGITPGALAGIVDTRDLERSQRFLGLLKAIDPDLLVWSARSDPAGFVRLLEETGRNPVFLDHMSGMLSFDSIRLFEYNFENLNIGALNIGAFILGENIIRDAFASRRWRGVLQALAYLYNKGMFALTVYFARLREARRSAREYGRMSPDALVDNLEQIKRLQAEWVELLQAGEAAKEEERKRQRQRERGLYIEIERYFPMFVTVGNARMRYFDLTQLRKANEQMSKVDLSKIREVLHIFRRYLPAQYTQAFKDPLKVIPFMSLISDPGEFEEKMKVFSSLPPEVRDAFLPGVVMELVASLSRDQLVELRERMEILFGGDFRMPYLDLPTAENIVALSGSEVQRIAPTLQGLTPEMKSKFFLLKLSLLKEARDPALRIEITDIEADTALRWQANNQQDFDHISSLAGWFAKEAAPGDFDKYVGLFVDITRRRDISMANGLYDFQGNAVAAGVSFREDNEFYGFVRFLGGRSRYADKAKIAAMMSVWSSIKRFAPEELTRDAAEEMENAFSRFSRDEFGIKAFVSSMEKITDGVKRSLLKHITGMEIPDSLLSDQGLMSRILVTASLYYSIAGGTVGLDKDAREDLQKRISEALKLLVETGGSSDAVRDWMLNDIGENREEVEKLVFAGYDRSLWEEGVTVKGFVTSGMDEAGKEQQLIRQTQQLVEMAKQLGVMGPEEMEGVVLSSYGEAAEFVKRNIVGKQEEALGNVSADVFEEHVANAEMILSDFKRLERAQAVEAREEEITIVISKNFLNESNAGVGVPGCFNPFTGIHREMPVMHGLEANAFFAIAYDSSGKQIANTVLAMTDRGVVVFGEYNAGAYNLAPLWAEAWKELAKRAPAVILRENSAGIVDSARLGEKAGVTAVRRPSEWDDPYFDFGEVDEDGAAEFKLAKAVVLTRGSIEAAGGYVGTEALKQKWDDMRRREERVVSKADREAKARLDRVARAMASDAELKRYLPILGKIKSSGMSLEEITRDDVKGWLGEGEDRVVDSVARIIMGAPAAEAGPAVRARDSYIAFAVSMAPLAASIFVAFAASSFWGSILTVFTVAPAYILIQQAFQAAAAQRAERITAAATPADPAEAIRRRFGPFLGVFVNFHEGVHRFTGTYLLLDRIRAVKRLTGLANLIDEVIAYGVSYVSAVPLLVYALVASPGEAISFGERILRLNLQRETPSLKRLRGIRKKLFREEMKARSVYVNPDKDEHNTVSREFKWKDREGNDVENTAETRIPNLIRGDVLGSNEFRVEQKLGEGGFGMVYRGSVAKGPLGEGTQVALKIFDPELFVLKEERKERRELNSEEREEIISQAAIRVFQEYMMMRKLDDVREVLKAYEVGRYKVDGKEYFFIAMEYADGGDLEDLISRRKGENREELFETEEILEYARQMMNGLGKMHERGIYNCDIKPGNIFFVNGKLKIGDFGISTYSPEGGPVSEPVVKGSPDYIPRETYRRYTYSPRNDLYAAGCLLYQMMHNGKLPYKTLTATRSLGRHFAQREGDIAKALARLQRVTGEGEPVSDLEKLVIALLLQDRMALADQGQEVRDDIKDLSRRVSETAERKDDLIRSLATRGSRRKIIEDRKKAAVGREVSRDVEGFEEEVLAMGVELEPGEVQAGIEAEEFAAGMEDIAVDIEGVTGELPPVGPPVGAAQGEDIAKAGTITVDVRVGGEEGVDIDFGDLVGTDTSTRGFRLESLLANIFTGRYGPLNRVLRLLAVFSTPIHEAGHILAAKFSGVRVDWTWRGLFSGEVRTDRAPPAVRYGGIIGNLLAGAVSGALLLYSLQSPSVLTVALLSYIAAVNLAAMFAEFIGAAFGRGDIVALWARVARPISMRTAVRQAAGFARASLVLAVFIGTFAAGLSYIIGRQVAAPGVVVAGDFTQAELDRLTAPVSREEYDALKERSPAMAWLFERQDFEKVAAFQGTPEIKDNLRKAIERMREIDPARAAELLSVTKRFLVMDLPEGAQVMAPEGTDIILIDTEHLRKIAEAGELVDGLIVVVAHEANHIENKKKGLYLGGLGLRDLAMEEERAYNETLRWARQLGYASEQLRMQEFVTKHIKDNDYTGIVARMVTVQPGVAVNRVVAIGHAVNAGVLSDSDEFLTADRAIMDVAPRMDEDGRLMVMRLDAVSVVFMRNGILYKAYVTADGTKVAGTEIAPIAPTESIRMIKNADYALNVRESYLMSLIRQAQRDAEVRRALEGLSRDLQAKMAGETDEELKDELQRLIGIMTAAGIKVTPRAVPGKGVLWFATGAIFGIMDLLGITITPIRRDFVENYIVPVLEESGMFLGLYFCGPIIYLGIRGLFIALHAFQDRAPPAGAQRTLLQKIAIPAIASLAALTPLAALALGTPLNPVIFALVAGTGLFVHILGNRYVTEYRSNLQKAVLGVDFAIEYEGRWLSVNKIAELIEIRSPWTLDLWSKLSPMMRGAVIEALSSEGRRLLAINLFHQHNLSELRQGVVSPDLSERKNAEELKALQQKVFEAGKAFMAHGVDKGLGTFLKIILDGKIDSRFFGALMDGDPSYNAGPHGPHYIIVNHLADNPQDRENHLFYLVPDNADREVLMRIMEKAVDAGLVEQELAYSINRRIVTYSQFVEMSDQYASQIGKKVRVTGVSRREGRTYLEAESFDKKGKAIRHDIPLEERDKEELKKEVDAAVEMTDERFKPILRAFREALERDMPSLYVFSPLVGDLFGYASPPDGLIAVHERITDNPVAFIHEIGEYLINSGRLDLRYENGAMLVMVDGEQAGEPMLLGSDAVRQAEKNAESPHYLLRSLQREIFGESDEKLTDRIQIEQITKTLYERLPAGVQAELDITFFDAAKSIRDFMKRGMVAGDMKTPIVVSYSDRTKGGRETSFLLREGDPGVQPVKLDMEDIKDLYNNRYVGAEMNILITGAAPGTRSSEEIERYMQLAKIASGFLSGLTRNKLIAELRRITGDNTIEFEDLGEDVYIRDHIAGSNKHVFKIEFRSKAGDRTYTIAVATKTEQAAGDIQATEIRELQELQKRPGRVVPRFGADKMWDGRRWYTEEFVEGKTGRQLDSEGAFTKAMRSKIISTLLSITVGLGGLTPSDIHGGNFVISEGTEEAVMVDIGSRRFRLIRDASDNIIDQGARMSHKLIFLATLMSQYGFFEGTRDGRLVITPEDNHFIFETIARDANLEPGEGLKLLKEAYDYYKSTPALEVARLFSNIKWRAGFRNVFDAIGADRYAGREEMPQTLVPFAEVFMESLGSYLAAAERAPPAELLEERVLEETGAGEAAVIDVYADRTMPPLDARNLARIAAETAAAVRQGKAVRIDLSGLMGIGDRLQRYTAAGTLLRHIAEGVDEFRGDTENEVSYPALEILKNAVVHGNRLDLARPVFMHVSLDAEGKADSLKVYDMAMSEKEAADPAAMEEAKKAGLHGSSTFEREVGQVAEWRDSYALDRAEGVASIRLQPAAPVIDLGAIMPEEMLDEFTVEGEKPVVLDLVAKGRFEERDDDLMRVLGELDDALKNVPDDRHVVINYRHDTPEGIIYTQVIDRADVIRGDHSKIFLDQAKPGSYEYVMKFQVFPEHRSIHLDAASIGREEPGEESPLRGRGFISKVFDNFAKALQADHEGWEIFTIALEMGYKGPEEFKIIPYFMEKHFDARQEIPKGMDEMLGTILLDDKLITFTGRIRGAAPTRFAEVPPTDFAEVPPTEFAEIAPAAPAIETEPYKADRLVKGIVMDHKGEVVHMRGMRPDIRIIRSYLDALRARTSGGDRIVPAVRKVYLPLTTLRRRTKIDTKNETELPAETIDLLKKAAQEGTIELVELRTLEDYDKAADELGVDREEFRNLLYDVQIPFLSEYAGRNAQTRLMDLADAGDEAGQRDLGAAVARALRTLHANKLHAGDPHLGQFTISGDLRTAYRVDLGDIKSFDDMAPDVVMRAVQEEYDWIEKNLEGTSPAAAQAFRKEYPREMMSAIAGENVYAARGAIGDLRGDVVDWVVTPMAELADSAKSSIDSGTRRKFSREYGTDTFAEGYTYKAGMSDAMLAGNMKKAFTETLEKMSQPKYEAKKPRAIIFVPADKYDLAKKTLGDVLKEMGLEGFEDRISIIKEGNIAPNGMVDEVMHVVSGKALLNYERFRKGDYPGEFGDAARLRLANFLKTLVEDPAAIDLASDPDIINKILDGIAVLTMKRIDYEEIQEWKNAQDEVLRSL